MHTDYNGGAIVEWSLFWLSSCIVVQSVLVYSFICIEKFMAGTFFYSFSCFELSNDIYMLLVDATFDGETTHDFYMFKLNLTHLFKLFFY